MLVLLLATAPARAELCGDADGTGGVNVTDGIVVLNAAAGLTTPCTSASCDTDGNGAINVTDGIMVLRAAAGLPVAFACPDARTCADLAGRWGVHEEIDITCSVDGEEESTSAEGEGVIDIWQDGCTIGYSVPGLDVTRSGTVEGDTVTLSGPFAVVSDQVDVARNEATMRGQIDGDRIELDGTGIVEGSVGGRRFRCSGESTAVLTRMADAALEMGAPPHEAWVATFTAGTPRLSAGVVERFTTVGP